MADILAISQVGPSIVVSVSIGQVLSVSGSVGAVLVMSEHTVFQARHYVLEGTAAQMRTTLLGLGFSKYSHECGMVAQIARQRAAPQRIVLGRRAVGDATWGAAFDAVKVALDTARIKVAHVFTAEWDTADQRAIGAKAMTFGWLPHFRTASTAVRDNSLGSLDKLFQTDGTIAVLTYYDPSGDSSAAAPFATTTEETWALSDGDALSITQDEETPEEAVFNAARARVQGSAGTYNLEPNWQLVVSTDEGPDWTIIIAATAAVVTGSETPATFVLVNGQTVAFLINGALISYTVDSGEYADVAAATPEEIRDEMNGVMAFAAVATASVSAGAVRITVTRRGTGSTWALDDTCTPAWSAAVGFDAPTYVPGAGNVSNVDAVTPTELDNLATTASGDAGVAAVESNSFILYSLIYGTGGSVNVKAASTNQLTAALGISEVETLGTGDAIDASAVTATELYTLLNGDISDPDLSDDGDTVTVTGTQGIGNDRTLYIVGPLADKTGLAGTFYGEGVDDDYAECAVAGCRVGLDLSAGPPDAGNITWNLVQPDGVFGSRTLTDAQIYRLNNTQHVNTIPVIDLSVGAEFHDGRLVVPASSSAPQYIDQWIAARFFAQTLATIVAQRLRGVAKNNDQISMVNESEYTAFLLGCVSEAETIAVRGKTLAFVDITPKTADKPTGVRVLQRGQLATAQINGRQGQAEVWGQLATALHGAVFGVVLYP